MRTRFTITFSGRVQGVGFRATTRSIAAGFNVTGFVRNQRDGTVLCVVEGERDEIDRFIHAVRQAMEGGIANVDSAESAATGEFEGFGIRR